MPSRRTRRVRTPEGQNSNTAPQHVSRDLPIVHQELGSPAGQLDESSISRLRQFFELLDRWDQDAGKAQLKNDVDVLWPRA